ncbi:hypothetical protein JKP88DRAFT_291209 [Tribonema minus]|uniref:Uncharacterized protein n=1 Tax=Tribonema minus TaxID=303371 RepID=A0A836CBM6_9STRA|nr:hypothetical protein JKP88DRAFT_291209 [Tribonema minus]
MEAPPRAHARQYPRASPRAGVRVATARPRRRGLPQRHLQNYRRAGSRTQSDSLRLQDSSPPRGTAVGWADMDVDPPDDAASPPPPTTTTSGRPSKPQARASLAWDLSTPSVVHALDQTNEADLLLLRFTTTANPFRTQLQCTQWARLVEHATRLLADATDSAREAARVRLHHGAGAFAHQVSQTLVQRGYRLLHLLAAMAFGRQPEGTGMPPAARLAALLSGDFAELLRKTLSAAAALRAPKPNNAAMASAQTNFDADWTEADSRQQTACAALSGKRRGVGLAAARLEAREACAPADEVTAQVLAAKHPETGTRPGVVDTPMEQVRGLAHDHSDRPEDAASAAGRRLEVEAADILSTLSAAGAGKAGGLDGLRYEHLLMAAGPGIGQKRRPIACSSVWRRLLGSTAARSVKGKISGLLASMSQFGVGYRSGVEHVAARARVWHELYGTTIQLDWCQQGDPLGPLYFAVAAAFLLFYPDGVNATPGSMPAYGHSTAEPPAPHCAFLDDLNVLQAAYFDDAAAAGVAEVIRRLAAGGLRVRPDKSLAIAMRGTVFDEAARARLRALDIPFVDTTMPESSQGFTSVGAAAAAATVPGPQAAAAAAPSTPAKTQTSAEESSCSGGQEDDDDDWEAYADEICRKDCLVEDLEAASAGAVGKPTQAAPIGDSRDTSRRRQQASARVLAQLRSQRASGAMAWMSVPPTANDRPGAAPMSSMAAATMILIAIFIDGWGIQGEIPLAKTAKAKTAFRAPDGSLWHYKDGSRKLDLHEEIEHKLDMLELADKVVSKALQVRAQKITKRNEAIKRAVKFAVGDYVMIRLPRQRDRPTPKEDAGMRRESALQLYPIGTALVREHRTVVGGPITYVWGAVKNFVSPYWRIRYEDGWSRGVLGEFYPAREDFPD